MMEKLDNLLLICFTNLITAMSTYFLTGRKKLKMEHDSTVANVANSLINTSQGIINELKKQREDDRKKCEEEITELRKKGETYERRIVCLETKIEECLSKQSNG